MGWINLYNKSSENNNQQQNADNFNVNPQPQQQISGYPNASVMPQQNVFNETATYQKQLLENKNLSEPNYNPAMNYQDSGYEGIQNNINVYKNEVFAQENNPIQRNYNQTPSQLGQDNINNHYQNQQMYQSNAPMHVNQQMNNPAAMRMQRPMNPAYGNNQMYGQHPRGKRGPNNYYQDQYYEQEYLDFESPKPIDYGYYGNYEPSYTPVNGYSQQYQSQYSNPYNNNVNMGMPNYEQYQAYDQYNVNPQYNQAQYAGYSESYYGGNYEQGHLTPSNHYQQYERESYKKRMKQASIIPGQISKEIKSEKLRNAFLIMLGVVGIIIMSVMLAVYYNTTEASPKYMGIKKSEVMYPFFSIFFLLISVAFFGIGCADYGLLISSVRKYENELYMGKETIPFFITRNYCSFISRSVYINWIAFSTYIVGAISLGILYGLEALHEANKDKPIGFLFWSWPPLKSFKSDIIVNIIVLFSMLGAHIINIITTRSRKNNIIGYYGFEIIPQQQINDIRKKANRRCLIIFLVTLGIILFAIVIPWMIVRKKKGQSLKPWKSN
ncbi:hypothetical protein SCHIN_v1c04840 [Spiroplasma chinense]|uniref:Transmembrane protein n=1 Tax=Spiroplasma chinense TaxID=216932 RepID=A0A5B9Y3T4_9MOLU|nr:hypothetical protein [Spiroplasma chinense]QEH61681.1 hypothetical protein SCHIN_v1c04840 [Spiroplasma chinense]